MINRLIFLFLLFSIVEASANVKEKIIQNLETTNNLTFNFEQNVNGKTENGHCALSYPQKIFCKYNLKNKKILVSNGKSIVIKTNNSYYLYPLKRTPLNLILNKKFLIYKIILVSVLAIVGILSLPILLNKGNTHFKHALEWNYFVGVIMFYLFSRFFWRRTT